MKNPTLATVLNIIPGLGYVYLGGKKRTFGAVLLVSVVAGILASFDPLLYTEEYMNSAFRIWDWIALVSILFMLGAFMYDGYISAIMQNAAKANSRKK